MNCRFYATLYHSLCSYDAATPSQRFSMPDPLNYMIQRDWATTTHYKQFQILKNLKMRPTGPLLFTITSNEKIKIKY